MPDTNNKQTEPSLNTEEAKKPDSKILAAVPSQPCSFETPTIEIMKKEP